MGFLALGFLGAFFSDSANLYEFLILMSFPDATPFFKAAFNECCWNLSPATFLVIQLLMATLEDPLRSLRARIAALTWSK